jgi:hypothetical protein
MGELRDSIQDLFQSPYFVAHFEHGTNWYISIFTKDVQNPESMVYLCDLYKRGKLWGTSFDFYPIGTIDDVTNLSIPQTHLHDEEKMRTILINSTYNQNNK